MTRAPAVRVSRVSLCRGRVTAGDVTRAARRAARERPGRLQSVSVTFVTPREIAALNRRYLGRRGRTDVIAFPLGGDGGRGTPRVGDVYICPEVARASARRFGVTIREELLRLVVHGTLHCLGYEHPEGRTRERSPFFRRQERIVAALRRRRTG